MSDGPDMSAIDADTKLDSAAHGGCPSTTCWAGWVAVGTRPSAPALRAAGKYAEYSDANQPA